MSVMHDTLAEFSHTANVWILNSLWITHLVQKKALLMKFLEIIPENDEPY